MASATYTTMRLISRKIRYIICQKKLVSYADTGLIEISRIFIQSPGFWRQISWKAMSRSWHVWKCAVYHWLGTLLVYTEMMGRGWPITSLISFLKTPFAEVRGHIQHTTTYCHSAQVSQWQFGLFDIFTGISMVKTKCKNSVLHVELLRQNLIVPQGSESQKKTNLTVAASETTGQSEYIRRSQYRNTRQIGSMKRYHGPLSPIIQSIFQLQLEHLQK